MRIEFISKDSVVKILTAAIKVVRDDEQNDIVKGFSDVLKAILTGIQKLPTFVYTYGDEEEDDEYYDD